MPFVVALLAVVAVFVFRRVRKRGRFKRRNEQHSVEGYLSEIAGGRIYRGRRWPDGGDPKL